MRSRLLKVITTSVGAALICGLGILSSLHSSVQLEHERLKLRNDFKNPEDVVRYYCARDASGFVWSGLLDSERRAFTLWREAPQQDSFYIAKKYDVVPLGGAAQTATVEVRYQLTGVGDAHGTRLPAVQPEMRVKFSLKKIDGAWKIAKPGPESLAPVVLESKFPFGQ